MLRCNCKKYRASFRLCLFHYCFYRKRSIAPLLSRAFLSEPPMALHDSIVPISFLHIAYIEPAALPSYIAHLHQYFTVCFSHHEVLYIAKCENFETFIRTIHNALLFFIQVIHRILLNRIYVITMTTTYCLCLPYICLHSIHN